LQQTIIRNKWEYVLRKHFTRPSMVLIGGVWKSGKTDFALKISEDLKRLPFAGTHIIEEVASNIETFGTYPLISDLISLRQWLYSSPKRKLYILDEASEHLSSRRAMSAKNVGFVQLIPEISKAHARLIVVGHQLLTVDKTLLDDTYCRGAFIKINLKKAQLISQLIQDQILFQNIPATTIKFDPYAIAPFTEFPTNETANKDEDVYLLTRWARGESYTKLGFTHPQAFNRRIRKALLNFLEKSKVIAHT
jgi:hypothetical protein